VNPIDPVCFADLDLAGQHSILGFLRRTRSMTVKEASEVLGRAPFTVRQWWRAGKIPCAQYSFSKRYVLSRTMVSLIAKRLLKAKQAHARHDQVRDQTLRFGMKRSSPLIRQPAEGRRMRAKFCIREEKGHDAPAC
jgi:hypothetical protein